MHTTVNGIERSDLDAGRLAAFEQPGAFHDALTAWLTRMGLA